MQAYFEYLNVTFGNVGQFFAFALFLPQVPSIEAVLHLDLFNALNVIGDVVVYEIFTLHITLSTFSTLPAPLLTIDLEDPIAGTHVGQFRNLGRVEATFGIRQTDPVTVKRSRDAILAQLLGQFALGENFRRATIDQERGRNEDHHQQQGPGVQERCGWHFVVVVGLSEQMDSGVEQAIFWY